MSEQVSAPATDTPPVRSGAAAFIFVTILLDMLALGLILPILPKLVESFVDNDTVTAARIFGLFGTAWAVMQFIFSPILGALSDRFGRRAVLVDGMALYCIASVIAVSAQSFETLLLARALQGIGTSATRVIATSIVRAQEAFLEFGAEAMRPLVLKDVAEEIGMHESTVSRVTTRKFLHTPRGTFEFKYFFSSGVSTVDGGAASATAIQAMIRKLIGDEKPARPMSDQALAAELNKRGISVARRTVAKYREAMNIPSSNDRSRLA